MKESGSVNHSAVSKSLDSLPPPWTVAHQAPLSMEFSRQECWSGLLFLSPGDLPDTEIKARSPALQADSLLSEPPGTHHFSALMSLTEWHRKKFFNWENPRKKSKIRFILYIESVKTRNKDLGIPCLLFNWQEVTMYKFNLNILVLWLCHRGWEALGSAVHIKLKNTSMTGWQRQDQFHFTRFRGNHLIFRLSRYLAVFPRWR